MRSAIWWRPREPHTARRRLRHRLRASLVGERAGLAGVADATAGGVAPSSAEVHCGAATRRALRRPPGTGAPRWTGLITLRSPRRPSPGITSSWSRCAPAWRHARPRRLQRGRGRRGSCFCCVTVTPDTDGDCGRPAARATGTHIACRFGMVEVRNAAWALQQADRPILARHRGTSQARGVRIHPPGGRSGHTVTC